MTIQFEVGLRRLHTLPVVTRKADWAYGLKDKSVSVTELVDFNGLNLRYTSLRDLISPTDIKRGSPKKGKAEWCDLSQVTFKDRLVKQAARAYLQPMVVESHQEHFLVRYWRKLTNEKPFVSSVTNYVHTPLQACIDFFTTHVCSKVSKAFEAFVERMRPQIFGFLCVRTLE